MAESLPQHCAISRNRSVNDAEEIDVHHAPKIVDVAVPCLSNGGDSGIVEYKIESSVGCNNIGYQRLNLRRIRDINPLCLDVAAPLGNDRNHLLCCFHIDVSNHNTNAVTRKSFAQRAAYSSRTARDYGDFMVGS